MLLHLGITHKHTHTQTYCRNPQKPTPSQTHTTKQIQTNICCHVAPCRMWCLRFPVLRDGCQTTVSHAHIGWRLMSTICGSVSTDIQEAPPLLRGDVSINGRHQLHCDSIITIIFISLQIGLNYCLTFTRHSPVHTRGPASKATASL